MNTSKLSEVKKLYEESADSYNKMMDIEIKLPIYSDTLSRLANRINSLSGSLVDTSCGTGHMLDFYHSNYDASRSLIGIDLSKHMVDIASKKLGNNAIILVGDMCDMSLISPCSSAAIISFFAIHHIDPTNVVKAFKEWNRSLCAEGQLVIAAWEGSGFIDYGEDSNIVASKYTQNKLTSWVSDTGFVVDECKVELIEEMSMNAIYLEATKK
ncbi:MAG: hypothetical protein DRR16_10565 [Candidatus Parabeggiatoa sp. nov. 3]|nr:MAG: hypothetical protein DRR00_04095 [Gammaproteobacteria bacterium]RKZ69101.1 MAG: hypothetical protein DRQ99_01890 [Gammaproteobacteria bacterium]RKZ86064.1 MAG: hypothetical protein DRR16_10565 [Gammaproteobacteria bacterium]